MPYRIAAFGDELSPDIQLQLDHLRENGIGLCALRGVNNKHVTELEEFQRNLIKQQFFNRQVKFASLSSTVGGGSLDEPAAADVARLHKAAKLARFFETKAIHIGSYQVSGAQAASTRGEVLARLKAIAGAARTEGMNLLLANAPNTYGNTGERCQELLAELNAPHVRLSFDFAGFVLAGDDALQAWERLRKSVVEFRIKDATADGRLVPIGEGAGHARAILTDAFATGWAGYLTLEPHLAAAGSGPKLFQTAAEALQKLLGEVGAK